jgi:hypothetical protein
VLVDDRFVEKFGVLVQTCACHQSLLLSVSFDIRGDRRPALDAIRRGQAYTATKSFLN